MKGIKHLVIAFSATASPLATIAQTQPNIVFFLVDDMGWQETSVPFWHERTPLNERYRTPNMERLARMGVKFTEAYACAVSSPSRCSLMSGMNAARHRVTNWTLHYSQTTDQPGGDLILPQWNCNGIQPEATATPHDTARSALITPLPELLRAHGYYTIHCGKAHFAAETTAGADPLAMGFDVNIAGGAAGGPASYLGERQYGEGVFHVAGLEAYYADSTFLTEALTREAIKALRVPIARRQPFYLYMSHYAIHVPYDEDRRFSPNYRTADGRGVFDEQLGEPLNDAEINHAALVEGMDKSLGDLLDFLESQPDVARNTIVLFMSDNGGQAIWPRQGTWNRDQNFPARAGKGAAYLGGVREPMIVSWPGVVAPDTKCGDYLMIEDFYPTILEIAGVQKYTTVQKRDGISFMPLLTGKGKVKDRDIYWHYPHSWGPSGPGIGATCSIRSGDWKLVYYFADGKRELFNIPEDISEKNDVAIKNPRIVKKLAQKLSNYLRSVDAQRPTLRATGKLAPWPDEIKD